MHNTTVNGSPDIATLDRLTALGTQLTPFRLPDASERAGEDVTVALRRLHPLQLAAQGALPEALAALALSSLGISNEAKNAPERRGVREVSGEVLDLLATTCAAVIAEPAMDADAVRRLLSVQDQQAIFDYSNEAAGTRALARFREPAEPGVAPVDDGADLEGPAE